MPGLRSCVVDLRQHSLARQRQIAHAHADRVEHRVGDRRRDRTGHRLADAERRLVRSVDDGDLDRRRLAEAQDRIVVQVRVVMRVRSNFTCSFRTQLTACTMPPSIWFFTPSGLIVRPQSTAATARTTLIVAPASTSTTTAA